MLGRSLIYGVGRVCLRWGCYGWISYVIMSSGLCFLKKSRDWDVKQYIRYLGIYEIVFPSPFLQNVTTILNLVFLLPLLHLSYTGPVFGWIIVNACIFLDLDLWFVEAEGHEAQFVLFKREPIWFCSAPHPPSLITSAVSCYLHPYQAFSFSHCLFVCLNSRLIK